jgi:hypothetical protein
MTTDVSSRRRDTLRVTTQLMLTVVQACILLVIATFLGGSKSSRLVTAGLTLRGR